MLGDIERRSGQSNPAQRQASGMLLGKFPEISRLTLNEICVSAHQPTPRCLETLSHVQPYSLQSRAMQQFHQLQQPTPRQTEKKEG